MRQLPSFSKQIVPTYVQNNEGNLVSILSFSGSVPDVSPCLDNRMWGGRWSPGLNEQHAQAANLVMALPLDDGSGARASDLSTYRQHGTLNGFGGVNASNAWIMQNANSINNGGYFGVSYFNVGNDSFIRALTPQSLMTANASLNGFTISVWATKPIAGGPPQQVIATTQSEDISEGDHVDNGYLGWLLYFTSPSSITFNLDGSPASGVNVAIDNNSLEWFHIVVVVKVVTGHSAYQRSIYINGQLEYSEAPGSTAYTSPFPSGGPLILAGIMQGTIGGGLAASNTPDTGNAFFGQLRDFRFYDKPITAGEVFDLWRYPDELYQQPTLSPFFAAFQQVSGNCLLPCGSGITTTGAKAAHVATPGLTAVATIHATGKAVEKDTANLICVASIGASARVSHLVPSTNIHGSGLVNRPLPITANNQRFNNLLNKKHPLATGLQLWYLADPRTTKGYKWFDLTRNGNDAILLSQVGTTPRRFFSSTRPGALGCVSTGPGSQSYVVGTSQPLTGTGAFSVSIWVFPTAAGPATVFYKSDSDIQRGWYGELTSTQFRLTVTFNSSDCIRTCAIPPLNQWTLITCVWRGGSAQTNISIFFNGVEQPYGAGASDGTGSHLSDVVELLLGVTITGLNYFAGFLDDFRVWSRALSASDAMQVYQNSIRGYPGLINRATRLASFPAISGTNPAPLACNSFINGSLAGAWKGNAAIKCNSAINAKEGPNNCLIPCNSAINAHAGVYYRSDTSHVICTSNIVAKLGEFIRDDSVTFTDSGTLTITPLVIKQSPCLLACESNLTATANASIAGSITFDDDGELSAIFPFGTGGDVLRFFFTGATADGGTQAAQAGSLGHYRSSTEASRIGILQTSRIAGLTVVQASGHNQPGTSNKIAADTDTASYTAPNSTLSGPLTYCAPGNDTMLADGADSSSWIRVNRSVGTPLAGLANLELTQQFNNVFGMSNAPDSESTSGSNKYRAVMLRNDGAFTISSITVWINAGEQTAITGSLGASGSGTITAATGTFCGFLPQGWVRIQQSNGTLREIVYYSAIDSTNSILTVPSYGRGRLGTSAAAGSNSDFVFSVPPVAVGFEAPSPLIFGSVQTIANENTAPTAISFNTGITAGSGLTVGTLTQNQMAGLWLWRELPATVQASAKVLNSILCSYVSNGVTYYETLEGLFRIAVNALQRYELFIGTDSPADTGGTPTETFTSFPHTTTATYSGSHTYYLTTVARNAYNLASVGDTTQVKVSGGSQQTLPPSAPVVVNWSATASGAFTLQAAYYYQADSVAQRADKFNLYIRFDGTDPVPSVDTPVVVSVNKGTGIAYLNYTTATHSIPTTAKVIVRTKRSSDSVDSGNFDENTATSASTGFTQPQLSLFWRQVAQQT